MEKRKTKPRYNMWQNVGFMLRRSWTDKTKSTAFLTAAIALAGAGLAITQLFVTPMVLGKVESSSALQELLATILGFTGLLIFFSGLEEYLQQNALFGRIEIRTRLIGDLHRKMCVTSYPNQEDPAMLKLGEKAGRACSGNNQPTEAVWQTLSDLLKGLLTFLAYLLVLSSLDPVLLIAVLLTSVAGYLVNKRINEWGYRHREEQALYEKKMEYVGNKCEDIKLAKDVRLFGMRAWLEDLYQTNLRLLRAFVERREKVYLWANVVDAVLIFLRNGIAYFYLINMALQEGLPASEFLLYFSAASGFSTWVTSILEQFSILHKQSLELSIVREFLDWPEPFRFEGGEDVLVDINRPYELKLDHVSFRYPGAEKDVLHDVSLTIPAGEKLAVVGLNGAGKTTLVKLLCGFYDPTEGKVLLNGRDIREFDRRQYYKLFSAVFQDFSVLECTLEENVAQTVGNIDEKKVWDCLQKAGLLEKVKELPQGLSTHIGRKVFEDGVELSGGETQRLMLSRALYKNGPVLVLDEPTAALDPIAENDIYQKYNDMTQGRTSVFISHRLASTRFCDRILFIADGGIAEEGTHQSLLEKNGRYAELFHIQSRYYQEGEAVYE